MTLSIWDESGFSFVPNIARTWAPIGETPILFETPGRLNHTGLGYITRTPARSLLKLRFTIFEVAARFEDFVFHLTELHHYYGDKVLVLWDHLPAHHAAETCFEDEHSDWFEFYYFPTYSPELNPMEQCWNQMKNVFLVNFVAKDNPELHAKTREAASDLNADPKLLPSFFHHAKLRF